MFVLLWNSQILAGFLVSSLTLSLTFLLSVREDFRQVSHTDCNHQTKTDIEKYVPCMKLMKWMKRRIKAYLYLIEAPKQIREAYFAVGDTDTRVLIYRD